jgi:hypothetical protein
VKEKAAAVLSPQLGSPGDASGHRGRRYHVPPIRGHSSRRFGLVLLLTTVLLIIAWPFFTLGFVNQYDTAAVAWSRQLYRRKELSLQKADIQGKGRLIIVGGSGALFGVDAELIERKLGVPTVNFGTHAGLNAYILHRAKSVCRSGDTILLCPEYELWRLPDDDISDIEWGFVITEDKGFIWSLGVWHALEMLYSQPGESYEKALYGWRSRLTGKSEQSHGGYNLASLGTYGDLYRAVLARPFKVPDRSPVPSPADLPAKSPMVEFAQWAKAAGIRVLFSWPNCCRPEPDPFSNRSSTQVAQAMVAQLGFIPLNEPADTAFPPQWFTDTIYHADGACRRIRTEDLIRRLRPYFGLPQITGKTEGIYLVTRGVNLSRPGNSFVDRPGVRVKYLSQQPVDHPDAITPSDLPALAMAGIPIWFDDPAIADMIPAGRWTTAEVDRDRISLADWIRRYDNHLLVIARAGGGFDSPSKEIGAQLGPALQRALESSSSMAAIVGTGRFGSINRLVSGHKAAHLQTTTRILVGTHVPVLSIIADADPARGLDAAQIRLDNGVFVQAGVGEIVAAAIDPEFGVMSDVATFHGNEEKTLWSMRRLLLRDKTSDTQPAPAYQPAP